MTLFLEPTILLTGATGQIGFELRRSLQGLGRIIAPDRHALNLLDLGQIQRYVRDIKPNLIVNPAAYTAVDNAETDQEAAMTINASAAGVLADEACRLGAPLIHYSTDYVFDGRKDGPYTENDPTGPLNMYGSSKLAGESAVRQRGGKHLILRTSWVYGARGRNFLRTMLRLAAERPELRVVADQTGAPTWSGTIAAMTAQIVVQGLIGHRDDSAWWAERSGVYHLTASGSTSWAGFAEAIFEHASAHKLLSKTPVVTSISSSEYLAPAQRPQNSRLSNAKLANVFGLNPPHWRDALALCLDNL